MTLLTIPLTAQAATATGNSNRGAPPEKAERLNQMKSSGASDDAILSSLGLERVATQPSGERTTKSASSDVTLTAPSIYYDTLAKYYYASASFSWNNDAWKDDITATAFGDKPMGGPDGFGIQTDRTVENLNGSMYVSPSTVSGETYSAYTTNDYFDNNGAGETINVTDRAQKGLVEYSAAKGDMTWGFQTIGNGCANFSARYIHTWDDSSLTGFSVSTSGFGASISNSQRSFQRTSESVRFGC